MNNIINIFTDGACSGNGTDKARAGWAYAAYNVDNVVAEGSGRLLGAKQTNNRAELTAVYEALQYIVEESCNDFVYNIYSDSKIIVDSFLGLCSRNANKDIWDKVQEVCDRIINAGININIQHISAHQPEETSLFASRNNYVDKIARIASRRLI